MQPGSEQKTIGPQKAKQGRRGSRAFLVLVASLVLAAIVFLVLMLWRSGQQ